MLEGSSPIPGAPGLGFEAGDRQHVRLQRQFVEAARAAGGTGYVVKMRLASDLMLAVQEARDGRSFVSLMH